MGGESAGAFWTLAPAALAPPHWRGVAYAAALTFGAAVGLLRMMFGGHFFSDVVFSGVFVFLVVWIIHGILYRWRATRTSDKVIEHASSVRRCRFGAPPAGLSDAARWRPTEASSRTIRATA